MEAAILKNLIRYRSINFLRISLPRDLPRNNNDKQLGWNVEFCIGEINFILLESF